MHPTDMEAALHQGMVDEAAAKSTYEARLGEVNANVATMQARFDKVRAALQSSYLAQCIIFARACAQQLPIINHTVPSSFALDAVLT